MSTKRLLFIPIVVLTVTLQALAQQPPEPGKVPMHRMHTLIEIGAYQQSSNSYEIIDAKLPGQGPFYATMDELVKALPALKLERLRKNPTAIVSNQYQLDAPMRVLAPSEIDDLVKRRRTKK